MKGSIRGPGCFFCLWPLFARAPRRWFLEHFLLSAPGVQSVFFLLRSVERRDLSAGPEQKKTPPRVLFFAPAPGKGRGRRRPRAGTGPEQKKKHHPGCVFLLRPRRKAGEGEAPLGAGTGPEQKKKLPGWCFFFCSGPGERQGKEKPSWAPARTGPEQKKTPWVVFFFCCGPARTLTHSLRAWAAMPPLAGVVFFFLLRPRPDRGGVFFLLWPRPDAHSLWAGAISARPGWCFFLLRPRRVFLDNNKKCLGYHIGSKKTRRGHSKKKHHFPLLTKSSKP